MKGAFEGRVGVGAPIADAERLSQETEIGVEQIDAEETALVAALLDGFDQGEAMIVDKDNNHRQFFLHGSGQLHAAHEKAAVAGDRHDHALRKGGLGPQSGRQAITHGDKAGRMKESARLIHRKIRQHDVSQSRDVGADDGIALDDLVVTFTDLTTAPVITGQPQSRTNFTTTTATFSVTATGTAPLSYQWRSNSIGLAEGGRFGGVTNSLLSITGVQTNDAADYTVVLTNALGAVTSTVARLTVVIGFPPNISPQPTNQTVAAGSDATFQISATGTAPLSYQWRFENVPLAGRTTNTLTLTNAQAANAGNYTLVVTNVLGAATSQVAVLTVTPAAPRITLQPRSLGILFGASGTLTAAASGTEPLSFQWQFNTTNFR